MSVRCLGFLQFKRLMEHVLLISQKLDNSVMAPEGEKKKVVSDIHRLNDH